MISIEATQGAANANSYCTIAFARAYHETQLHNSDWFTDYTQEQIAAALITVTRFIDYYEYKGYPVDNVQGLKWPRRGVYYNGGIVDSSTIPIHIQYACAQIALDYLRQDLGPKAVAAATTNVDGQIASIKAGSVEIKYAGEGATVTQSTEVSFISPEGFRLLQPFLGINYSGHSLIRV